MSKVEIKIEWKGLKKFEEQLIRLLPNLTRELEKNMREGAEEVRDEAKRLVATDTFSLQTDIMLQEQPVSGNVIYAIGVSAGGHVINPKTGRIVDYAGFQEYGTSRIPAHPYLRPAVANKMARFAQLLKEAFLNAIRKH